MRRCCGCDEFEFVTFVLEHGLSILAADDRLPPFDVPTHSSCCNECLTLLAMQVLAGAQEAGIDCGHETHRMGRIVASVGPCAGAAGKGLDQARIIHDIAASRRVAE